MTEEIDPFEEPTIDEGAESTQPVNDAEETAPQVDSTEETKQESSTGENAAEDSAEGEQVSETTDDEKTPQELLADVDKEIANDKHPKWYKANLQAVKNAFLTQTEEVTGKFKPLEAFGDVEKISNDLQLVAALTSVATGADGKPVETSAPFVEKLMERSPNKVLELFSEIAYAPCPGTQHSILDETLSRYGLDPTRLSDYKRFAENGYQLNAGYVPDEEELRFIPENLREAYLSLTQVERDRISPYEGETEEDKASRESFLNDRQFKLATQRTNAQAETETKEREEREKAQAEATFKREWETETTNSINSSDEQITGAFVASLVNSDVGLSETQALGLALTIQQAIDADAGTGKMALAHLQKEGVSLPDNLGKLFEERNKMIEHLAFYKKEQNEGKAAEIQKTLSAKIAEIEDAAKPIIAHYAKQHAETNKARIEKKNTVIDSTQAYNTGISPNEGIPATIGTSNLTVTPTERERILDNPFG